MNRGFLAVFEEELSALYERAGLLVSRFPELGLTLSRDGLADADISMRLLLEGSAYLSARAAVRAELTHGLLARRLATLLFPGCLEPIPPRCLIDIGTGADDLCLGRGFGDVSIVLGDRSRTRFEARNWVKWPISDVTRVDLNVRWLGGSEGAQVEFDIHLASYDGRLPIREFVFFVGTTGPGREASPKAAATLLSSVDGVASMSTDSGGVRASFGPVDCNGKWISGGRNGGESDLTRLSRYLHWADLSGFVKLSLSRPLERGAANKFRASFRLPMADEAMVRELGNASVVANIFPVENKYRRVSDRFSVDARRGNNYFSFAHTGDLVRLVSAKAVRLFRPLTNIEVPARLVSYVGSATVDRGDGEDVLVIHEPDWVQPDQDAMGSKLDRLVLSSGSSSRNNAGYKFDAAIEADVYDETFPSQVVAGSSAQAEVGSTVLDGRVVGRPLSSVTEIPIREQVGKALSLGLGDLEEWAKADSDDLRERLEQLVLLCSPASSPGRLAWQQGLVGVSLAPRVSLDSSAGVASVRRGWRLTIDSKRLHLAGGLFVFVASAVHRYLAGRAAVNSSLQTILRDENRLPWCIFGKDV